MSAAPRADDKATESAPLPDDVDRGSDDGVLDSLGKAVAAPVKGAAEPDEPGGDARKPPVPPG